MLCENCGKREANVRYSENINGVKKEMHLCEECSRKLGISSKMDFSMPSLDIPSFFGSFLEDFSTPEFMPFLNEVKQLTCDSCGSTFEDIINFGRYGCANCYDVFEDRMDPILKKLQGANRHNGRLGKISDNKVKFEEKDKVPNEQGANESNKLEKLQNDLKLAIKEERYEDAAKLRDEIKEMNKYIFKNERSEKMNWYLQSGKESDVVTSTRIRFARNLPEFKFNLKDQKDIEKLKNKIKEMYMQ